MSERVNKKNIIVSVLMSLAIHSLAIAGLVGVFSFFNSIGTNEIGGKGLGVGDSKSLPQYIQVSSVSVETSSIKKADTKSIGIAVEKNIKEDKVISEVARRETEASLNMPTQELGSRGDSIEGGEGVEGKATELSLYVQEVKKLIGEKSYYPEVARKRAIEGTVNVSFSISSDGVIYDVQVSKKSGFTLLDENALSIVESVTDLPKPPRDDLRLELPLVFSIKTIW